jgi:hypothetical protein
MFLFVLVTCVTLEGQTMCNEFVYAGSKSKISKAKLRKSVGV